MNEQMLELYKQAWVPCTHKDPSNNMPYESTEFSANKFAELIVKKCATVIKDCEKYGHSLPLEFEVMNHFGVE
jgi:hypothetical protein